MARAYICAYFDFLETYAGCSDEEFGRLFRAAIRYGKDGEEPSFPEGSLEAILWPVLEGQVRRDIMAYSRKVKGGVNRWSKKVTNGVTENQPIDGQKEVFELQKFIDSMKNTSAN